MTSVLIPSVTNHIVFPLYTLSPILQLPCQPSFPIFFLFFFFWLRWVFVAACRLSLVATGRGYSSLWYTSFSLWWLLLLQSMGSRCVGFSSCCT